MRPKAEDVQAILRKTGVGGFGWRGMRTEGDPATNAPDQPRLVVNLHQTGGAYEQKPYWVLFNGEEDDQLVGDPSIGSPGLEASNPGLITSVYDLPLANTTRLYVVLNYSLSNTHCVCSLDPEQDPEFRELAKYDSATKVVLASFGGRLHVAAPTYLYRPEYRVLRWGETMEGAGGEDTNLLAPAFGLELPLAEYAAFLPPRCALEFDGRLYVGMGTTPVGRICTWDGVTFVNNDLTGVGTPTCMALYREPYTGAAVGRDTIVVGFTAAANHIRYRPPGAPPGTWTTKAPGAGTVNAQQMIGYKGKLYIANGDDNVFVFDAQNNTLTAIPAATTGIGAGSVTKTVAVGPEATGTGLTFDRYLYVGYVTAANQVRVARFDGANWVAAHADITALFPTIVQLHAMVMYRTYAVVFAGLSTGESRVHVKMERNLDFADWKQATLPSNLAGNSVRAVVQAVVV